MTRYYLPLTLASLRGIWEAGRIDAGTLDDAVIAEGDDEESEYAALMSAADLSADLPDGAGRRVVVVAEASGPVDSGLPLRRVVAVHADPVARAADADPDDDLAWYATQEVSDLFA